jgi:hypothetical protein
MIELFAARDLHLAFLAIALMTAPWWLLMLFFPGHPAVRRLAQPWFIAPLYGGILIYLIWQAYAAAALPDLPRGTDYAAARGFARHPIAFLAIFCNLQILNLFMGMMMYQKATRCRFRAPLELTLTWLLGALGLIPFALRLLFRKQLLR